MYLPITDGFVAFKDSKLHTIPASTMGTCTFLLQTVLWLSKFLTSHNSCLYNADMYLPNTDGFVAFKDSILHTIPASAMRTRTFLLQTVL